MGEDHILEGPRAESGQSCGQRVAGKKERTEKHSSPGRARERAQAQAEAWRSQGHLVNSKCPEFCPWVPLLGREFEKQLHCWGKSQKFPHLFCGDSNSIYLPRRMWKVGLRAALPEFPQAESSRE